MAYNLIVNAMAALGMGWLFISLFYRYAMRPVLVDKFRYSLFEIRDRLRMLAINGEINSRKDFTYAYLERRLCHFVSITPDITPVRFFYSAHKASEKGETYESKRFSEHASPKMKELWGEALKLIILGILINSTFFAFPIAVMIFIYHWMEWIRCFQNSKLGQLFKKMAKAFIEQEMVEVDLHPELQPA